MEFLGDASDILLHLKEGRGRAYGAYLAAAVLGLVLGIMLVIYLRRRNRTGWEAGQIERKMEASLSRDSDGDLPPGDGA